jgi:restriction system protein
MSIPDFQTIMLPMLELSKDGQEYKLSEAIDNLSHHFKLTDADRQELLPSGKQSRFSNRVGWSCTHLKKAGMLHCPSYGKYQITPQGLSLLASNPTYIGIKNLKKFPEYLKFIGAEVSKNTENNVVDSIAENDQTPVESLELIHVRLRQNLADELLEKIKSCTPQFFERLVVELLVKMGYGGSMADAGKAVGQSGDGGIDGIIKEDPLGLSVIYLQAKCWQDTTVGSPDIQKFIGALASRGATKGVFITTSKFSKQAKACIPVHMNIILIDGQKLAKYAIEANLGVSVVSEYQLKKIDISFFEDI